ncbi:hypothetical protein [Candidatus Uabimicrobium sp. HlEnr_7]|uniref:hypothetical protein n=1 Tax=Candidatus Uabimicrobium helgolandensis TaxID=3095367 RepID=UPI0035581BE5
MEDKKQKARKFKGHLQELLKNEEWDQALVMFDELIKVRATPQRWCNRSFVLLQLGKIGLAIEGYKKALKIKPDYEIAHKGIAKAEELLRDLKSDDESEIVNTGSEISKEDINEEQRLVRQFQDFARQKNWNQALIILDGLIAIKPTVERLCNQGTILAKQGSLKMALASYNGALQLNSNSEAAQKGIKKVQKMIYEVREGTKEEPLLAVQLVEDKSYTLAVFIGAAIVFVFVVALAQNALSSENQNIDENATFNEIDSSEGNSEKDYALIQQAKGLVKYNDKWITSEEKHALEQKAKGLVKYNDKWVTSEEKYALEQEAKGLILYNNKWITSEEKYALEQKAKGLIEHKGKWITSSEKYILEQKAKGLVKYNDKWITPLEKYTFEQKAKGLVQYKDKWVTPSKKYALEQKAKGFVLYENTWITKQEWQKKQEVLRKLLPKKLKDYYRYLQKECSKASKEEEFQKAYLYMQNNIKSLDKFLGIDSNSKIVKKIRRKMSFQKSYVFPLRLFKQQQEVAWSFSPGKMASLGSEIYQLKLKFAQTINNKETATFELENLKTKINKSEQQIVSLKNKLALVNTLTIEIKAIKKELEKSRKNIASLENRARRIDGDISSAENEVSSLQHKRNSIDELSELRRELRNRENNVEEINNEIKQIDKDIDRLERRINETQDENEKQRLKRSLSSLESKRKQRERTENDLEREAESAEYNLSKTENKLRELDNKLQEAEEKARDLRKEKDSLKDKKQEFRNSLSRLDKQQRQKEAEREEAKTRLPEWKSELKDSRKTLQSQKLQQENYEDDLRKYQKELQPLTNLQQQKRDILGVVEKYQRWWTNLQGNKKIFQTGKEPVKRPLKNMLVALFVLHNFPAENIRTKVQKGYRSLGRTMVYFR